MRGMRMSRTARSGSCCRMALQASAPSAYVLTRYPSRFKAKATVSRMFFSSSTTATSSVRGSFTCPFLPCDECNPAQSRHDFATSRLRNSPSPPRCRRPRAFRHGGVVMIRGAGGRPPTRWMLRFLVLLWLAAHGKAKALPDLGPPVKTDQVRSGSLLVKTDKAGVFLPAPALETDVVIRVTGMVARTRVRQRFANAAGDCVEGVYVFPLPEGSAVDHMRLRIGDRVIDGEVRERQEAKKVYEQAKAEGKKASLLEQERSNVFTASVASIGANEEVEIEIEYQETLRFHAGRFHLRFPMVVAPRYVPGNAVVAAAEVGAAPGPASAANPGMGW